MPDFLTDQLWIRTFITCFGSVVAIGAFFLLIFHPQLFEYWDNYKARKIERQREKQI